MLFILEHTLPRQSIDSVFPTSTNLQVSEQSASKAMDQETDTPLDNVGMENCKTVTDSQYPDNFLEEQIDFELDSQSKILVHKVQTFHQGKDDNYIEPTQSTSSNGAENTPKRKNIPISGAIKKKMAKDKNDNDDSVLTGATKALNTLTSAIVQLQATLRIQDLINHHRQQNVRAAEYLPTI
ncbi:hypothetical protein QE152_g35274 [Popillia japonica]|uniref:Uncharacterized protein n=1 Tax=Popillia japonica TaxID=7064 RepID=A0AAW1IFX1_POPJA